MRLLAADWRSGDAALGGAAALACGFGGDCVWVGGYADLPLQSPDLYRGASREAAPLPAKGTVCIACGAVG